MKTGGLSRLKEEVGSCIRQDREEKDGTKKRNQSLIAQEKPLSFME